MQRGTPPQEVIDNHPHILRFVDADNEILPHYFISIEQQLHMEANSFVSAIYYLFVTHYIFNISCMQDMDTVSQICELYILATCVLLLTLSDNVL